GHAGGRGVPAARGPRLRARAGRRGRPPARGALALRPAAAPRRGRAAGRRRALGPGLDPREQLVERAAEVVDALEPPGRACALVGLDELALARLGVAGRGDVA